MSGKEYPYLAFIIKPTYNCNMMCKYCSVYGYDVGSSMNLETVDVLFERAIEFCGNERAIYFIWHGGEPLLMGAEFYRYIGHKTEENKSIRIMNGIQSNALLLADEMIDIIIRYKFKFSTSLDGPAEVHNRSRLDLSSAPTFDKIMDAVLALRKHGVNVGAITVLNKLNIDSMSEIYRFFNQAGIHLRINPVLFHGSALVNFQDVAISPVEYGEAMIEIFDMWYHDPEPRIMLDPFRVIIGNIATGYNESCGFRNQCHNEVISIGPGGDVYPCGQFNGSGVYHLGNIHHQELREIMNSPSMQQLLKRTPQNIKACGRCPYVELCYCGCTASAVCRNGEILQPDYYCSRRKMIFQHILDTIEKDMDKALTFGSSFTKVNSSL